MKIYLSHRTAGRYGGGLKGNLSYFDKIVEEALDKADFRASYDELWLVINYPPMYVLPGVVGIEKDFEKFYNTLPTSRLNRKYKKIDIELKAPEFSEHFDGNEKDNYEHIFDIDNKFKNLTESELAKILIDKYLEAVAIVNSKLKKEDVFDFELFKSILISIKQQINPEYLASECASIAAEIDTGVIKRAISLREERKRTHKVKDKKVRDLRVYYAGLPENALYPYDCIYAEIFRNILRKNELLCPTYQYLYIQIGKTMEDCLGNSLSLENWYMNGLSVINFDNYLRQTEDEKQQTVFNVIVNGLKDIVDIDKLDSSILDKTINEIKQKELDTELEYRIIENNKHKLTISYLSRSIEEGCPIYFTLLEKNSNRIKKKQIGVALDNIQLYFWLQKVALTSTQIKVKSSNSIEADVWLSDKIRDMEFNIKDFLNE